MQQLYVLRRSSGWSFRLVVSVALLIGSAALATSLLVGAAIANASVPRLSWQPTARLTQPASELNHNQPAAAQSLPVALSSTVPGYSSTAGTEQAAPASSYPAEQAPSTIEQPLPAASTLKATVQRSWHTFKLAFR